jgi:hypothetical protein
MYYQFPPSRQRGLIIHGVLIAALAATCGAALVLTFQSSVGPRFTLYILVALATFFPLPILGYRAYALLRANYTLDRDKLHLSWGLRMEEIPLSNIEWVRPAQDLTSPLTLPVWRIPGGVLGMRHHPDLGDVEFLAAESDNLLLVATAQHVFAISPADPAAFVRNFQHAIEMGSLAPGTAHSQYPSFIIVRAWESPLARYLWLSGLFLNIGLLIWVTVLIPLLKKVPLGFSPTLEPVGPFQPLSLILIPLLSILLFVIGWLAGLFFYRRETQHPLAFMMWISSAFSALLFLLAVLFLLSTPI